MVLGAGMMLCTGRLVECVRMGAVSFFSPLQKLWSRVGRAHDPRAEPQAQDPRLLSRIRFLQNQALHQREVIEQLSKQLQMLHAFRRVLPHLASQGSSAEVIGRDTSMFRRSVIVDAGTTDGVHPDCPALVDAALIGRVSATWLRASRVMLISDPASAVPVLVTRTREQGIVQGTLDDQAPLQLQYVDRFSQMRPKDVVVTSGVGGVFPKGIVVGTVLSCNAPPGALFKRIVVRPAVDLSKLERAVLLRRSPRTSGAPTGPSEQPTP